MPHANSDHHHPPNSAAVSLLSVSDVANACGLSRRAVYDAIKRGELPALRICSRLRIRPEDLELWLSGSAIALPAAARATRRRSTKPAASGSFRAQLRRADEERWR